MRLTQMVILCMGLLGIYMHAVLSIPVKAAVKELWKKE